VPGLLLSAHHAVKQKSKGAIQLYRFLSELEVKICPQLKPQASGTKALDNMDQVVGF